MRLAIAGFLLGLLVFYLAATFDTRLWDWTYYLWDKSFGGGVAVWYAIYALSRDRVAIPVLVFSIIRLIWEIISYFTGVSVNNTKYIAIGFVVLCVICLYQTYKECSRENLR